MIPHHQARHCGRSRRGIAAAWLIALAIVASGCGARGARTADEAAKRETSASPSGSASALTQTSSPTWIDTLQMISPATGWALVWPSNPNHSSALAVARTTDGGRTWTAVTPPAAVSTLTTGQTLLYAATGQQAWLVATSGTGNTPAKTHVFGTTDGGQSWRESGAVGGAGDPVEIDFAGPGAAGC